MPYNKKELFNLPVEEKLELVGVLWDQIDDELMPVTKRRDCVCKRAIRTPQSKSFRGDDVGAIKK